MQIEKSITFLSENQVKLCCSRGCPVLTLVGDKIVITDDFGGAITITKNEGLFLSEAVAKLLEND